MIEPETIGQVLQQQAQRTPDADVLMASGRPPMTYAGLAAQAERVRDALLESGIGQGGRVAVAIRHGPELAALFVCITDSATVLPLNSAYTQSEFEVLLEDARVDALIVEAGRDTPALPAAAGLGLPVMELAPQPGPAGTFGLTGPPAGESAQPPAAAADDVALVLYTSGTTSLPKRVPVTHRNILTSARNFAAWYVLEPGERTLSIMPYYHMQGLSGGIMPSLVSGGTIVCSREFDGDAFFALLDEFKASWYTAGPTFHAAILARAPRHRDVIARCPLRFIRSSSAPLPPRAMREMEEAFGAPMLEGYGLSETCMHALSNPLPPGRRKAGSVGVSAGTEIGIVDANGQPVAPGAIGEVVLRGANVISGYEDNPGANAAAFRDGWFRTGDEGHLDEDGYLILTGRYKEMINRGGEKIAPVEIDHVLREHPDIAEAVAFSVPHPTLGEEIGVAIVRRPGAAIGEDEVKSYAARTLAPFKVPRHVAFVDAIPKGTVGKSLRLGLAEKLGMERTSDAGSNRPARPPQSDIESAIAEIWQFVLRRGPVNRDDEFVMLGGDSLQAIHVAIDISERFEIELPFETIFEKAPTVASLARFVETRQAEAGAAALSLPQREPRDALLPASFAQEAFWVGSRLFRDQPFYNVEAALRLRGPLDKAALSRSLTAVMARHEILRTRFVYRDRRLLLEPSDPQPLEPEYFDLCDIPGDDAESRAAAWAQRESQRTFDIVNGPLWRTAMLRLNDQDHVLLVVLHHAIADGWGCEVLAAELLEFYAVETSDGAMPPPALELQCADFAAWQRRCLDNGAFADDLAYWQAKLESPPPVLRLKADRDRPEAPDWQGGLTRFTLTPELSNALLYVARTRGATLFMTLLAAFDCLLHAETDATDVVIGVPIANRPTRAFDRSVGCFINTLPFRMNVAGNPTFEELLNRVRECATEAYAHQRLPREAMVEQLAPPRGIGGEAFFCMLFQLHGYRSQHREVTGDLTVTIFDFDPGTTAHELQVDWEDRDEGLTCNFTYRTDLFETSTVDRWMDRYRAVLERVAADPATRLASL